MSAQTVWSILQADGLERLPRRASAERGAPALRPAPVKARALEDWPAGEQVACDHAGLLLLMPGIVELGLPELIAASGYPSTTQLSAWHSLGALLLAKCTRVARVSHLRRVRRRGSAASAGSTFEANQTSSPTRSPVSSS